MEASGDGCIQLQMTIGGQDGFCMKAHGVGIELSVKHAVAAAERFSCGPQEQHVQQQLQQAVTAAGSGLAADSFLHW